MSGGDWVRLNVGGTLFVTTRATLCMDKRSMLAKMFSGTSPLKSSQVDESGAFLIDRDPRYFRLVLNHLRTGSLTVDDDGVNLDGLLAEAEFFQLNQLSDLLQPHNRPDLTRKDVLDRLLTHAIPTSAGGPGSSAMASPLQLNLSRLRLMNVDFSSLALQGTQMLKANVRGAHFARANLRQGLLTKAFGERVDFGGANLSLSVFKLAYLHNSCFVGVFASNANFSGANLSGSDFGGANLQGALFQKASLRGCSFRGANLEHAKLQEADLRDADFTGAILDECHITDADIRGAKVDLTLRTQGQAGAEAAQPARVYTKGAVVTQRQLAAIPVSQRARLELAVLAPLAEGSPQGRRIAEEVGRHVCVLYVKGSQQDVLHDRFHRRLFTVLDSLRVPYVCKNAFDEEGWDVALSQYTSQTFLPKVFVKGRFIGAFSERSAIRATKRELKLMLEAALESDPHREVSSAVPLQFLTRLSWSSKVCPLPAWLKTTVPLVVVPPLQQSSRSPASPDVDEDEDEYDHYERHDGTPSGSLRPEPDRLNFIEESERDPDEPSLVSEEESASGHPPGRTP